MLPLPADLQARFEKLLPVNGVPEKAREFYLRWLQFYLDYCRKYDIPFEQSESQPLFLQKLQEKKLPPWQQEQASHAVSLYFDLISAAPESVPAPIAPTPGPVPATNPTPTPVTEPAVSTGASWREEFTSLTQEIKLRHYSPKTLDTYKLWLRKFQAFVRSKQPESLTVADVKEFLTWLAVKRQVAASTQNQAFNALLFFFRHVLHREFGKVDGVVRAKRRPISRWC